MGTEIKSQLYRRYVYLITCIVAVLLAVAFVYAVEIPTTLFVNTDPNVTTATLTDINGGTLQVNALDTAMFNCTGIVVDNDSYVDVVKVNATFYGTGYNTNSADTPGGKYSNNSCALYGGSGNSTSYTCAVYVHHHTLNGTWTCNASAYDTYGRNSSRTATNTVDVFKSASVDTTLINFGAFALGANSGVTDKTVIVNNSGNRPMNVTLDAYRLPATPSDANAMACTTGNLSVGAIRYQLIAGVTATSKISLTDAALTAPINLTNTAIGATVMTSINVYFGVVVPPAGLGGTCSGYLDISAI